MSSHGSVRLDHIAGRSGPRGTFLPVVSHEEAAPLPSDLDPVFPFRQPFGVEESRCVGLQIPPGEDGIPHGKTPAPNVPVGTDPDRVSHLRMARRNEDMGHQRILGLVGGAARGGVILGATGYECAEDAEQMDDADPHGESTTVVTGKIAKAKWSWDSSSMLKATLECLS